jgi:NitT/TauT family transport system ATP-binding protein
MAAAPAFFATVSIRLTNTPIVFSKVAKCYGGSTEEAVSDFSLSVLKGEFFCLVGPSGCGKSTVLKMIAGIERPTAGELFKPEHVGMVFQSYALFPWLTVGDNVAFAARMQRFSEEKVEAVTDRYLKMVHLEGMRDRYPRELSGGQRQRVGIARALAVEADVLLLDEPFSALDPVITDELHDDLLEIWGETKKTVVMVSHHYEEAVTLADRVGMMRDGTLERIIPISLPRPREEESAEFAAVVKQLRVFSEGRVIPT